MSRTQYLQLLAKYGIDPDSPRISWTVDQQVTMARDLVRFLYRRDLNLYGYVERRQVKEWIKEYSDFFFTTPKLVGKALHPYGIKHRKS